MGKAGSGKDTAAELLNCCGFYTVTLADNIRHEFVRSFPDLDPRLSRDKLIEMGQTYKRLYGADVWVRLLWKDIQKCRESGQKLFVVSDGRHQIEYDFFVAQKGFIPLRVDCPDEIRFQRLITRDGTLQKEALRKESQELWDANAYGLDNSGTLEQLGKNISKFLKLMGR